MYAQEKHGVYIEFGAVRFHGFGESWNVPLSDKEEYCNFQFIVYLSSLFIVGFQLFFSIWFFTKINSVAHVMSFYFSELLIIFGITKKYF